MNVFALDHNPGIAAHMMHDVHVVKMITETCQLFSAWARSVGATSFISDTIMIDTHTNHPCAVWLRDDPANAAWLRAHLQSMFAIYRNNMHGTKHQRAERMLHGLWSITLPSLLTAHPPPMALGPNKHKYAHVTERTATWADVVLAYRRYYQAEKLTQARVTFKNRTNHWNKQEVRTHAD